MLSLTAPDRPKVCLRAQAAARGQQRARLAASAGRSCFGRRRSAWANGAAGGLGGAAARTWAAGPPPSLSPTSPHAGAALPSAATALSTSTVTTVQAAAAVAKDAIRRLHRGCLLTAESVGAAPFGLLRANSHPRSGPQPCSSAPPSPAGRRPRGWARAGSAARCPSPATSGRSRRSLAHRCRSARSRSRACRERDGGIHASS